MLPSSPHVKQVYLQGIIPTLKELPSQDVVQTLCIDSTTLDVDVARAIATDISTIGAQMVDAPVSGGKSISHWRRPFCVTTVLIGVSGAKAATLSFLVGGTEQSFQLSQPVLAQMGQRIIHCGLSGAGLGAKICNNVSNQNTSSFLLWHFPFEAYPRCATDCGCWGYAFRSKARSGSSCFGFCHQ